MRSLIVSAPADDSYVTPHELMAELDEVASVFNALDRDNTEYPAALTTIKVAVGGWNNLKADSYETTATISHTSGQEGSVYPMPGASASTPWVLPYVTTDTILSVSLWCCIEAVEGGYIWPGIRVNGQLVRGPWSRGMIGHETHLIRGYFPVPAGTAIVEAVYGHKASPSAVAPWDLNFEHRRLTIRELLR